MFKLLLRGFLLFSVSSLLQGEVEEVTIRWNAMKCLDICVPGIQRNLSGIREVSNLQINDRSGIAVMRWSPNYPFSYEPFRLAMSAAGIAVLDMRLRVRGTISHDVENFYLTSTGDGARFLILGPILVESARYVPRYNPATHPLTGPVKEQLLEAEQKNDTVVISGPLYLPTQYPRTIMAEQIRILTTDSQMDPRYNR